MNVLLAGPNIYDPNRLGGIITVANTTLALFPGMEYFARSGEKGKGKVAALREFYSIVLKFRERVARGDIDVLHINSALERSAMLRDSIFMRIASKHNIPVVLHLHGGKFFTYKPDFATNLLMRQMLTSADQIIVLGKAEKEILTGKYGMKMVHILQNALDFSQVPAKATKLQRTPLCFIYLGRIDDYKGLEDILYAMKGLKKKNIPFRYKLCGNGPLTENYTEKCRNELGDCFEFGGVVRGDKKWQALNESDVFLLPSLYEGLPMSLLEAMAVGCLCITTAVGSIPEVVHHRENGLIVPKQDPEALQSLMEIICNNPSEFSEMAEKGKLAVEKRFNGQVFKESLRKIYQEVIKPPH